MKKEKLVNKIVDVCIDLKIVKYSNYRKEVKNNIMMFMGDVTFIESLYNTIFVKAKQRNILHTKKIKNLLMELEKTRLELE